MAFDLGQIINLVGQLGGDHQQALSQLQGVGQVDPEQHSGILQRLGVDPQQLSNGGYQQHLDAQQAPGFQGYRDDQGGYRGQAGQQGGYQDDQGGYRGQAGQQGGYQDDQGGYRDGETQQDYRG